MAAKTPPALSLRPEAFHFSRQIYPAVSIRRTRLSAGKIILQLQRHVFPPYQYAVLTSVVHIFLMVPIFIYLC